MQSFSPLLVWNWPFDVAWENTLNLKNLSPEEQLKELRVGTDAIISEVELLAKLRKSKSTGVPLIAKLGADPSRPDIHLGHTVVLNKLRMFQEFGHRVMFLIGDFTALIGDPTGKNKTRPQLTSEEVTENAESYKTQVFKILDPAKTEIVFNSHWLGALTPIDFVRLTATRTVQQLLARDDFATRYAEQTPIHLHELLYPLLQAYDSVHLKADVELGGTDQRFNLLMGRELQRHFGQEPQCVIMTPLIEGLDGVQKMSKSLDNYIGINESPSEIFGKTMSISDALMVRFYELLSRRGESHVALIKAGLQNESLHPMTAKKDLAEELVGQFWSAAEGREAREQFERRFSKKEVPQDLTVKLVPCGEVDLLNLAVELGFTKSKGEARRILQQQGMKLDDATVTNHLIHISPGQELVFTQGKLKIVRLRGE